MHLLLSEPVILRHVEVIELVLVLVHVVLVHWLPWLLILNIIIPLGLSHLVHVHILPIAKDIIHIAHVHIVLAHHALVLSEHIILLPKVEVR